MNKNRQIRKPGGEYLEVIAESNQIDGGSKERPLSAVSDEYVEIHDDIRSHASLEPLHTSPGESYDGYLKNPKEQGHRVTIQDNCAYNATVQIREETAISGRGRVIQSNSLYEEIPDRAAVESGISQATVSQPRVDAEGQKESKKIISPGEALWSFWQGKAEIAIRITNLAVSYTCITLYAFNYTHTHTHTQLGAVIFLLLFAIIVNAGRIYGTSLGTDLSARYTPTPTFATIASWMLMLTFAGTTEVFLFIARVYVTKATKCIMIWVRHNIYTTTLK